jgi:hypothetical protein
MLLTILAVTLLHYFPRLRYAILEGDKNYNRPMKVKDGVVSRPYHQHN